MAETAMAVAAPEQAADTMATTIAEAPERTLASHKSLIVGTSVMMSVPCFWGPRIQSMDLASHVYNAWLVKLASTNAVSGVHVTTVWTNTLFDWLLSGLMSFTSINIAERLAVWACVLTLFWGCFAFLSQLAGRFVWKAVPVIAAITYGSMFRLGFLNFYLATGLSLAAVAIVWQPSRKRVLLSLPFITGAVLAHSLPVAWAVACGGFLFVMRQVPVRYRFAVTAGAASALWAATAVISRTLETHRYGARFSALAVLDVTGSGQLFTYDQRFLVIAYAWLVTLVAAFALTRWGGWEALTSPPLHLWMLHVLAYAVAPDAVQFPSHAVPLGFIPIRIGWFASVIVLIGMCHVLTRATTGLFTTLAVIFLALTYRADVVTGTIVKQLEGSVKSLPSNTSVVAAFQPVTTRIQPYSHVLERACMGQCFSFGNYEPASRAFRLRADDGSTVATANSADVISMESGEFVRRKTHPPLYTICNCPKDPTRLCTRAMEVGDRVCVIDANRLIPLAANNQDE